MTRLNKIVLVVGILIMIIGLSILQAKERESYYQDIWCNANEGQIEVVMSDGSRCDCLTDEYAIEFDFDQKWAEAIGQSLLYASQTGKKPGIVLIGMNPRYISRIEEVIKAYNLPITLWYMEE